MKMFARARTAEVLAVLSENAGVWAPTASGNGRTAFSRWEPGLELFLDGNAGCGPKAVLFPPAETND